MVLEVGGTVITQEADDAAVAEAIRGLARQSEDEAFAILSRSDETYIQTVRGDDGTFGLEYQEGSIDQHYGCYEEDLDEAKVLRAFTLYLHNDPRWHDERIWEKMDL
jgi:hypothetical protein